MVPVIEGMTAPMRMIDPRNRTIEQVMAGLDGGNGLSGGRWTQL